MAGPGHRGRYAEGRPHGAGLSAVFRVLRSRFADRPPTGSARACPAPRRVARIGRPAASGPL
ncbi:hypothetical protein Ate01nite_32010 [Actinoplanes teichomyceticus]|nr:hypothetical protein Ate01nite_32010 [Actinoplanes teichomyceticus]